MNVSIKCFSTLADKDSCRYDQANTISIKGDNPTVQNLANQIAISEKDVSVVFVNGKHANMGSALSDGDRVAFVPPTGGM